MVHLGLEAVLAGTPATICKTKVIAGAQLAGGAAQPAPPLSWLS